MLASNSPVCAAFPYDEIANVKYITYHTDFCKELNVMKHIQSAVSLLYLKFRNFEKPYSYNLDRRKDVFSRREENIERKLERPRKNLEKTVSDRLDSETDLERQDPGPVIDMLGPLSDSEHDVTSETQKSTYLVPAIRRSDQLERSCCGCR
ncbi:unnamed protein product [Mytilus coruscus]|uniref:Uncharacterized protein n=1 Tax=Mytilus coruscus TaxID=42192 RepID=A0A6J8E7B6_MYTCO|nr:unnamed protein product [Mytilus coruscus]